MSDVSPSNARYVDRDYVLLKAQADAQMWEELATEYKADVDRLREAGLVLAEFSTFPNRHRSSAELQAVIDARDVFALPSQDGAP